MPCHASTQPDQALARPIMAWWLHLQVCRLVRLLSNLFPYRTAAKQIRAGGQASTEANAYGLLAGAYVQPFHKSVLDWFLGHNEMNGGEPIVDAGKGHFLLAAACARALQGAPLQELPPHIAPGAILQFEKNRKGQVIPDTPDEDIILPAYTDFMQQTGAAYAVRHAVAHALLCVPVAATAAPGGEENADTEAPMPATGQSGGKETQVAEGLLLQLGMWETAYAMGE